MAKRVRADFGKPVEAWFKRLKPGLQAIAEELRRLILAAEPTLRAELKWGNPCYSKNTLVCGLVDAKAHIGLFFHYGKHLQDPQKLLAGRGKTVRSVKFTSLKEIPGAAIQKLIRVAVAFDKYFGK